jgi:hypothetical protein
LSRVVWEYFVGIEFDAQAVWAVFGEAVFHNEDTMGNGAERVKIIFDFSFERE